MSNEQTNANGGAAINVFVIHTPTLTLRIPRLNGLLGAFQKAIEAAGRKCVLHTMTEPSAATVERHAADFGKRVSQTPTGDADFDRMATQLTPVVVSNLEKHRAAWRHIAAAGLSAGPSIVLEDDAVLFPDHQKALEEFVSGVLAGAGGDASAAWDFVPLGMSPAISPETAAAPFGILPLPMDDSKILPCKEAYWISPRAATLLLKETETFRFFARVQMSYILYQQHLLVKQGAIVASQDAAPLRIGYPVRRVTVEGSKLGLYTSSIHPNNMLILNAEYMKMFEMVRQPTVDVRAVKSLYKIVAHLRNPDLLHLYGVLLFKAGLAEEAEQQLADAVDELQKQHGHLSARSDILNNAINVQEFLQRDVAEIQERPSKYATTA